MTANFVKTKEDRYRLVGSNLGGANIRIDKNDEGWLVILEHAELGEVAYAPHDNIDEAKIAAVQLSREQHAEVVQFSTGMRGQFIISQALCVAIDTLKNAEPEAKREESNIKDMEYLRDNLYSLYKLVEVEVDSQD